MSKCACLYTLINHQCFRPVGTQNFENCDETEKQQNLACRYNQFAKNGKCESCAPICKTCKNSMTTCTSCNEGYKYFSNNYTCVSKDNFFEKNKGRTKEGKQKKWTIILSVVFVILSIVLGIVYMA